MKGEIGGGGGGGVWDKGRKQVMLGDHSAVALGV